jgi:uncharacterized protein YggE
MSKAKVAAVVFCLASILGTGPARGQFFGQVGGSGAGDNIEGFTVIGKGSVAAKPNSVEIDLEVSASSELTADAIVKYRDSRKKIQEAFAGLKLANVSVTERGLLVDQKGQMMNNYMFFNGMPQSSRARTEVQLSRKLVVKATDIRQMDDEKLLQQVSRLLDVAQDAGARIGGQTNYNPYYYNPYNQMSAGLIRFVLDDFDKLEEEAYEKAIADARTRAGRLAKLSRVELGPVLGVREVSVPGEPPTLNVYGNTNADGEPSRKQLVASKFQEIPVRVELLVRFAVHSKPDAKGRPGE